MYDVQLYVWCKVGKGIGVKFSIFFVNMNAAQLNILISSLFRIPSKEDIMPGGDYFTVGGDRLVENIKPLLFPYFQHQEIFPPAAWRPYPRCCKEPFGDSPVNPKLKTHLSCPGRKCLCFLLCGTHRHHIFWFGRWKNIVLLQHRSWNDLARK